MMVETRNLSWSVTLHTLMLVVAVFGLPAILPQKPEPVPLVMSVELLPISAMSNVSPSDKPITEEKNAKASKNSKPIEPTAKEQPKPPTPPEKPAEKPDAEPLPSDTPKPQAERKKPEPEKKKSDDFAALLSQLKQETKTETSPTATDTTTAEKNTTRSDAPYDNSLPLSISETDAIQSQFIPCWAMPAGAKDAHTLAVRVKMELQPDGTVLRAFYAPDQAARYHSDPFFRAAADSAVRAAYKCSPLKNLPVNKYGTWKNMELTFNPSDLL